MNNHLQEKLVYFCLEIFYFLMHYWNIFFCPSSKHILIQRAPTQWDNSKTMPSLSACLIPKTLNFFTLRECIPHLRPDFVPSNDEGHFAAPRIDEAGPAGV